MIGRRSYDLASRLLLGAYCGIGDGVGECPYPLWVTHRPASSLWCPVHGHVLDATVTPPLDLTGLIVCTR